MQGFPKIGASITNSKTAKTKGIQSNTASSAQTSFIIPPIHSARKK